MPGGYGDQHRPSSQIEMRSIREELEDLGTVFVPANENEI
jgi:hypothetical protein